ncbi:hypothetical protein L8T26_09040 [Lactococcus petauri]|uniref:hypothetical protein n=2 Tax=Streptococcaceae TaxID=1300 RepID=UPI001EDE7817|nr:hypothetical protein [Lactococcus petauri]MCG3097464.1 hypothetical protein [Lactococcus petauri]
MKSKITNIIASFPFQILLLVLEVLIIISFFVSSLDNAPHFKLIKIILIFIMLGLQAFNTQSSKNNNKDTKRMSDEEMKNVEQLINSEEDIKAIKKIREYTNLDLVSAKKIYEEMRDKINEEL